MDDLINKKVIITGGSRGIGYSILKEFYKKNSDILTIGSNLQNLENVKKEFPNIKIKQLDLKNNTDIKEQFPKRNINLVFGCGGERDIGKRSKMGAIAERYADYVVITNDNPRGESEEAIISHIKMGMIGKVVVEMDRRSAIRHAISHASPDDLILIAGKGHEEYQQLSHQTFAFSDQMQAKLALNDLTGAGL